MNPAIKKYQALWLPELIVLFFLMLLAGFFFRDSSLDLWAARWFYHAEEALHPWPEANQSLWRFFYVAAPWITGILLLGSLGILFFANFKPRFKALKIYAVFIFLMVGLGPGLLVNSVFKPYWGRPRPREIIELGGKYNYRPFYSPALGQPGKSFPCGHCSVGFSYGLFWWIFRRRRPFMGFSFLMGSLGFGLLMGIGRIADGGHFLSDVVWSALITWSVGFWLYYFALKIPAREDHDPSTEKANPWLLKVFDPKKPIVHLFYAALGGLTILVLLLASPFFREFQEDGSSEVLQNLKVDIDRGDVEFKIDPTLSRGFTLFGEAKGFGFPTNRLKVTCLKSAKSTDCSISRRGFFSDYESNFKIWVNPNLVKKMRLVVHRGDLSINKNQTLPENFTLQLEQKY